MAVSLVKRGGGFGEPVPRRLLAPEGVSLSVREGYAVCSGDVPKKNRDCEWRIVSIHPSRRQAEAACASLDPRDGRAVIDLSAEGVELVAAGKRKARDPLAKFKAEMRKRVGDVFPFRVPYGPFTDGEPTGRATVRAYPVGDYFVIHRTVERGIEGTSDRKWSVTHRVSRKSALQDVSRVRAIAVAVVLETIPLPWGSADVMRKGNDDLRDEAFQVTKEDLEGLRIRYEKVSLLT